MLVSIIDTFSEQEYKVLAEILSSHATKSNAYAKAWLRSFDPRIVNQFIELPLEDMCLYINEEYGPPRYVALWRLKIGR